MKSLTEYIKESITLKATVNYGVVNDIYMFFLNNSKLEDRMQAICDTYRKTYYENINADIVESSKIFNKFVEDIIDLYKKEIRPIEVTVGSLTYLKNLLVNHMIDKIKTEIDYPKMNLEDESI